MSTSETIFTLIIFLAALAYIYKSLFKSGSCEGSSCGCGTSSKKKEIDDKCCGS